MNKFIEFIESKCKHDDETFNSGYWSVECKLWWYLEIA